MSDEGARKFDAGKPRFDLLDWEAITDLARVMTMGAAKYDDRNYLGLEPHRVRASLIRHVAQVMIDGDDLSLDEESGLPHLAHVMANCMMLMEMARVRELNRFRWAAAQSESDAGLFDSGSGV